MTKATGKQPYHSQEHYTGENNGDVVNMHANEQKLVLEIRKRGSLNAQRKV